MEFPIWPVSVIMCGSVICIVVLSLHCLFSNYTRLPLQSNSTAAWQRRCWWNNHEKLIHVMAIFLNESRTNWEPHYSRPSEPIRSLRGEESGGYVFHMVRESAICYDSQVEECMHSENSHLPFCHFVFYSATMSSQRADIIFKVLHFQKGQTQIFILSLCVYITIYDAKIRHVRLLMNFLILILFNNLVSYEKMNNLHISISYIYSIYSNHIKWCSAQPKWTDWQLTWPIIRAGRSRYKRSGNFCGQL